MPHSAASRPPPLAGVRVLDFTRVLAGPWCTLNLADLGADVMKVENPKGGDDTRHFDALPERGGETAYFLFANRNKRSIALDIASPEGQAVVKRLAGQVDVLVENFRPDVMARQGLDYASLAAVNPRLIYCSVSGYGHDSPQRLVAGYDPVAQAESGMMWMTGEADGPPLRTGISFADIFTGMFATQAVIAALRARDRDGQGQFIDIALLDSAVAVVANYAQAHLLTGAEPMRYGNGHPFLMPFGPLRTKDGMITLVIGNEGQWQRFCRKVIERPDLLEDPRFATNSARVRHAAETMALLEAIFAEDTRESWIRRFHAAGVPAGSIRNVGEALAAPELRHRDMVRPVEHPRAGSYETVASPIRYSGTPVAEPASPPLLGQHGREILAEAGFDADEIDSLISGGIVGEPR